jgi:DEAD/DEAH box helicase domain-containing protein
MNNCNGFYNLGCLKTYNLMSLLIFKVSDYETTHEREIFDNLCKLLKDKYNKAEDCHVLIANPSFDNRDIDAIFIKRDAITVLEFKNYGGSLEIAENGDWRCDDVIVKGGSGGKNPYQQVKLNKTGLFKILNLWYPKSYTNLSHISGIVLFSQKVEIINSLLPPSVRTWFHITDLNGISDKFAQITSREINYTNKDLIEIPQKLNLQDCLIFETQEAYPELPLLIQPKEVLPKNLETIKTEIQKIGFNTIHHFPIPPREEQTLEVTALNLEKPVIKYLQHKVGGNLWHHQFKSIAEFKEGKNVCIATSTGSGKSLIFYSSGIQILSQDPEAKIIAIYPLKALGSQQDENWVEAINKSGLANKVGRIVGGVSQEERISILKSCSVVIFTPDVIHAFLLGKIGDVKFKNHIRKFLSKVKLIIIDEAHTYSGIFGSNAAYLFRRLNHAINVLSREFPQYLAASATIEEPDKHLNNIVGLNFSVIDNDTSPKKASDILLIEPTDSGQMLTRITDLVGYFAKKTDYKGITFMDSRKMVEQVAGIVNRVNTKTEDEAEEEELELQFEKAINEFQVYPYRAGYEKEDSELIQMKLRDGHLNGIISTSALELGIDIATLDLGILLGIPYSSTSFYQRIGRVGRIGCKRDGLIIIINDNSVRSATIFKDPKKLFDIPMAESALYLENINLQYIHALCFAESNGEYDQLSYLPEDFVTDVSFPKSFLDICNDVRNHNTTREYDEIKNCGGNYPHMAYPLRDLEPQFRVELVFSGLIENKGSLSYSQVMRETYPCAIYYYFGQPLRVTKVDIRNRLITVRREKRYYTKPKQLPPFIYPQLRDEKIFVATMYGELKVVELELLIHEKVIGLREIHGGAKPFDRNYPIDESESRLRYSNPEFSRSYRTTGTLLTHPFFNQPNVRTDLISQILYEIFLLNIPYEPQDVGYGRNKFKKNTLGFDTDSRFVVVYDQAYGSLRLTHRLTEHEQLKKVLDIACDILTRSDYIFSFVDGDEINEETIQAIMVLKQCLDEECMDLNVQGSNRIPVIKPNSYCLYLEEKTKIMDVVNTDKGLKYRLISQIAGGNKMKLVSIHDVLPIENESKWGFFSFDSYAVED